MSDEFEARKHRIKPGYLFGAILVVLGVSILIAQILGVVFQVDIGRFSWPFLVIVPGVFIFVLSLFLQPGSGRLVASFGGMVVATGLILFYQNINGHWASWAYAWALVAPASIGVGQVVYGAVKRNAKAFKTGVNITFAGLAIFLVGVVFFEGILGISGFRFRFAGLFWPVLLILVGSLLLVRNLVSRRSGARV